MTPPKVIAKTLPTIGELEQNVTDKIAAYTASKDGAEKAMEALRISARALGEAQRAFEHAVSEFNRRLPEWREDTPHSLGMTAVASSLRIAAE